MSDINLTEQNMNETNTNTNFTNIKKENFFKSIFKDPKKRIIFLSSMGAVILILFGVGFYFLTADKEQQVAKTEDKTTAEETKALFQAPLDGVMTDKEASSRHPLAIVVENHPDARPQSGLSKASIVYEAIAEGGITRFMAVFGTNEATKVGPVRSARTFFVDWAHGFNAYFAHVGGNMDALEKIPADKILDLDQFKYPASFWRDKSLKVATEHTMFTDTTKLRKQAQDNKYETANNFNVAKFKDEMEESLRPQAQTVVVDYSGSNQYAVNFVYDKKTNSYKRNMAGKAHNDRVTNDQITPKNIVVMTVTRQAVTTRINEPGWHMDTVGTGKAYIYLDGKETIGTWKKNSASERELFYDASGNEISFNRGQFWICVVPPEVTPKVTAQ